MKSIGVLGATVEDFATCVVVLVFFGEDEDAFAVPWAVFGALDPVVFGAVVFGAGPPDFLPVEVVFGAPELPCPELPLAETVVGTRTRDDSAINAIEFFRSLIA